MVGGGDGDASDRLESDFLNRMTIGGQVVAPADCFAREPERVEGGFDPTSAGPTFTVRVGPGLPAEAANQFDQAVRSWGGGGNERPPCVT